MHDACPLHMDNTPVSCDLHLDITGRTKAEDEDDMTIIDLDYLAGKDICGPCRMVSVRTAHCRDNGTGSESHVCSVLRTCTAVNAAIEEGGVSKGAREGAD